MTCEDCKVNFTEKRRNCHLCGANIGLHDKWYFDESVGGEPRHRHCENPQSYFNPVVMERAFEKMNDMMRAAEHQRAMESLAGSH